MYTCTVFCRELIVSCTCVFHAFHVVLAKQYGCIIHSCFLWRRHCAGGHGSYGKTRLIIIIEPLKPRDVREEMDCLQWETWPYCLLSRTSSMSIAGAVTSHDHSTTHLLLARWLFSQTSALHLERESDDPQVSSVCRACYSKVRSSNMFDRNTNLWN